MGALAIPFHSLITQVCSCTAWTQLKPVKPEPAADKVPLPFVQGSVDGTQLAVTGVLFAGCAAVSTTLWYLSRRYIGELSLLTASHRRQLCISTLDFWGNRQACIYTGSQGLTLQTVTLHQLLPPGSASETVVSRLLPLVRCIRTTAA